MWKLRLRIQTIPDKNTRAKLYSFDFQLKIDKNIIVFNGMIFKLYNTLSFLSSINLETLVTFSVIGSHPLSFANDACIAEKE